MNTIDLVLLLFLGFGLIRGFIRGLIVELATLLAVVLGIYGAIHFSFFVADILQPYIRLEPSTMKIASFAITLILIMLSVMLLAKILTKLAKSVSLGFLNRVGGAFFGLLKQAVIAGAALLFLETTWHANKWIPQEVTKSSVLYQPIKKIGELVYTNVLNSKSNN